MAEIRSIFALTREQIVTAAREQCDAGECMGHGFEPGSAQAAVYERAYIERQRELDALANEVV